MADCMSRCICIASFLLLCIPLETAAQSASPGPYTPISNAERAEWIVKSSLGPRSLATGVFTSGWLTAINAPREWERSWSGFGKRYVNREATVTMSNGMEAALGALWGEDPRYGRLGGTRAGARIGHAVKSSVLARGRNGRLRPAWARYTGVGVTVAVSTAWLPPSVTTPGATSWRVTSAVLGRLVGNVFEEFWPDVRERLRK
jgi:hypothetical protein